MSTVLDRVRCPQCGYEEAYYEFERRSREKHTSCSRCGYLESWEAKSDENGQFRGWKGDITKGFGVLRYRSTGGVVFAWCSLHTEQDVTEAERWLKEQLAAGSVEEDTARLTRWNEEEGRVELVVGTPDRVSKMEKPVADHKCLTCGVPLPKGTKYVWQGKNRWCEKCVWGEDSEDAATKIRAEFGAPEKEDIRNGKVKA